MSFTQTMSYFLWKLAGVTDNCLWVFTYVV